MNKEKNLLKMITFTRDGWDVVLSIQSRNSLLSAQEAVRYAVAQTERRENPAYIEAMKNRVKDPEEKAKDKAVFADTKAKLKEERQKTEIEEQSEKGKRYCDMLGGRLKKDDNGAGVKCYWNRGAYLNPKNASIVEESSYLENMTENDIANQFYDQTTLKPVFREVVIEALRACNEEPPKEWLK